MHPAPLPGRAQQDGPDGGLQALVGVADDEAHTRQATRPEAAQERRPERAVLAVADREAQDLPVARSVTPVATTIALDTTLAPSWALT